MVLTLHQIKTYLSLLNLWIYIGSHQGGQVQLKFHFHSHFVQITGVNCAWSWKMEPERQHLLARRKMVLYTWRGLPWGSMSAFSKETPELKVMHPNPPVRATPWIVCECVLRTRTAAFFFQRGLVFGAGWHDSAIFSTTARLIFLSLRRRLFFILLPESTLGRAGENNRRALSLAAGLNWKSISRWRDGEAQ